MLDTMTYKTVLLLHSAGIEKDKLLSEVEQKMNLVRHCVY